MSNTTIIRRNGQFILIDNEVETILTNVTKDGLSLILPENSSGRKFFALKKFEKKEEHDLLPINRNLDPNRETSTPKTLPDITFPKSHQRLHELMNEEELGELKCFEDSIEMYMELMNRVLERVTPKKRELTDIEKAELRVKRALEALEALKNQEIQG